MPRRDPNLIDWWWAAWMLFVTLVLLGLSYWGLVVWVGR